VEQQGGEYKETRGGRQMARAGGGSKRILGAKRDSVEGDQVSGKANFNEFRVKRARNVEAHQRGKEKGSRTKPGNILGYGKRSGGEGRKQNYTCRLEGRNERSTSKAMLVARDKEGRKDRKRTLRKGENNEEERGGKKTRRGC